LINDRFLHISANLNFFHSDDVNVRSGLINAGRINVANVISPPSSAIDRYFSLVSLIRLVVVQLCERRGSLWVTICLRIWL